MHFSEIRFLGNLEEAHLKKVRDAAAERGISVEIGMRSLCPSSSEFDAKRGTVEQQLTEMFRAARIVGSPIVRAFLGTYRDRTTPGGIQKHIENTIAALRPLRSRALDMNVRIAIENHAGDMQAHELKTLVEETGRDFVGVCIDSGNPLWALEDPHLTLETLHPYVLTSHIRDTAIWRTKEAVAVQWVRMGEGNVGISEYLKRFVELCPGKPVSLEIITTGPREFRVFDPNFWPPYRSARAWEFSRFLALAEKGTPRPAPASVAREQVAVGQREDLEASLRWTKNFFGMNP